MNKKLNTLIIESLTRTYQHEKRMLMEDELGVRTRSEEAREISFMLTKRMEMAAEMLDETSRMIITEVVFNNHDASWFTRSFSSSSYYRHREIAVTKFIELLKR